MTDNIIDNRNSIRQRLDHTALHKSRTLNETVVTDKVKLDIVASKVTIAIPSTLTALVLASIDNNVYYSICVSGCSGTYLTYGDDPAHHLVKYVYVIRIAGSGQVVIAATQNTEGIVTMDKSAYISDRVTISETVTKSVVTP